MMMLNVALTAIIVSSISVSVSGEGFLRFFKPDKASLSDEFGRAVYLSYGLTGPSQWYASWPNDLKYVVTRAKNDFPLKKLLCTVDPVSDPYTIRTGKVCFNHEGKENCKTVDALSAQSDSQIEVSAGSTEGKLTADIHFSSTAGITVTLNIPPQIIQSFTSDFYCSLTNDRGTITSNLLQIRDYRNVWIKGPAYFKGQPPQLKTNAPVTISCGTMSVPPQYTNYFWVICKGSEIPDCTGEERIKPKENWPVQTLANGSLYIPFLTSESINMLRGKNIGCYAAGELVRMFKSTLDVDNEPIGDGPKSDVVLIRPETNPQEVKLVTGLNHELPCEFTLGRGKYTKTWYKVKDESNVVEIRSDNRGIYNAEITENGNLKFIGKSSYGVETPGKYRCIVIYTPSPSAAQRITADYDVAVLENPTFAGPVRPTIFVMDGYNATLPCEFTNKFGAANPATVVTPSLAINGMNLALSSQDKLLESVIKVNSEYKRFMSPLTVSTSALPPQPGSKLTYHAINMMYNDIMASNRSTSHSVTCIGTNRAGENRRNTVLQVVPKLVFSAYPSQKNCSACSGKVEHLFKCAITNHADYNQTKPKILVQQKWYLGNEEIMRGSDYFAVSDDNTTLTVRKINDTQVKDYINQRGVISCQIALYYDGEVSPMSSTNAFYTTSKDARIKSLLSSSIRITDEAQPITVANMSWVIALSLSIFVVIIIIVIVFAWHQRRRVPGETYDVDRTEKKQGNDPETENREKELFKTYERPDAGPIRGSRMSLDESINVGSDDEDLNEYDMQMEKFNEEGSFIGQYNDGQKTGQNLPPAQ